MWTPERKYLSSDSEGDSPTNCDVFPYYRIKNDALKTPMSGSASAGTTKTTQLSPLSFGSASTPPTSPAVCPFSPSSLTPEKKLNVQISFCESDESISTISDYSIFKISRRITNEWKSDFSHQQLIASYQKTPWSCLRESLEDYKFRRQRYREEIGSRTHGDSTYALKRAFGTNSLLMAILSMTTCSFVTLLFVANSNLFRCTAYNISSLWEMKATEFRSPPKYSGRNMLNTVENSDNNVASHALVSELRPIYRVDDGEQYGELNWKRDLGNVDSRLYSTASIPKHSNVRYPRTFIMHNNIPVESSSGIEAWSSKRYIDLYPAVFSDNTQLYGIRSSDDEALSKMEIGVTHKSDDECLPMKDWQTAYYPSCNDIHTLDTKNLNGDVVGNRISLLGTKGYWRNVWKVDVNSSNKFLNKRETLVLKTLKYSHNFEHAHYERDRIDAIAMERLTSSSHVVNIYGFCGRSVLTEFANGPGLGTLADKSKKYHLKRLKIARDIASGLADVHSIGGNNGNSTIVHMDINPANVVVVDHNLKLNDFNIAVMLKWNTTSSTQCGFPAQYPNPQWRSPEEAKGSQHLTEKIDVFSMGHIFFRMICGHEPWNKLEKGGRPTAMKITEKVKLGALPRMPDNIRHATDPEIKAIRTAMLACYTTEPTERPSSREIADFLDNELQKLSHSVRS